MKKVVALLLVLVLVSVSAMAMAATSPSTATVADAATETGVVVTVTENEIVTAAVEAIAAVVTAGAPAVSVYPEDVQAAIAEKVEDVAALELAEVVALDVDNYEAGEVVVTMEFATKFTAEQKVVVVISADDADYVCDAVVTAAGALEVTLTEEVAAAVAAAKVVVAAVFAA